MTTELLVSHETQEKKEHKYRSRTHALILYPEDKTHIEALEKIQQSYDYIGICHDKDLMENGEPKKPHFHIIIRTSNSNPIWNTALCKDLGIETNYTQQVKNMNNAMMYLIHANDPDKAQYELDDVFGTMKPKLKELINGQNKSEGEKIVELIEYIEKYEGHLSVTTFAKYCANNGYWAEFRRSGSIFVKMIDEKNKLHEMAQVHRDSAETARKHGYVKKNDTKELETIE